MKFLLIALLLILGVSSFAQERYREHYRPEHRRHYVHHRPYVVHRRYPERHYYHHRRASHVVVKARL